MSSDDLSQQQQCGIKTFHVQAHPHSPETQGDPSVPLTDVQECFLNGAHSMCGDQVVITQDANNNELAHQSGEVIDIMTNAVSTSSPGRSHESNLVSPRQLTEQNTILQSTSVSTLAKDKVKQSPAFSKDSVGYIKEGQKEQADLIQNSFQQCLWELKAPVAENDDLHQQACETQQPMLQMQRQVRGQPVVTQERIHALLRQTYELHEYPIPIPRLFVILPKETAARDDTGSLANQFRLYFLCECGKHTKELSGDNVSTSHHIHLVKDEGYDLQRPSEFFQMFGRYMVALLEMIKDGTTIDDFVVPTLPTVNSSEALDIPKDSLNTVSQSDVEQSIHFLQQFAYNTSVDQRLTKIDETDSFTRQDAWEGADLRHLKTFIKDKDEHWVPDNLYRTITQLGHVKWICVNHYRLAYKEVEEHVLAYAVVANRGRYQPQLGKLSVTLGSSLKAAKFFNALAKAGHVDDLDISFDWDCSKSDLEVFEKALKNGSGALELCKSLKNNSTLRELHLAGNSIGDSGARAISEALKTNSTLIILDLVGNSIKDDGARALSEALKINLTLTSLDLRSNLIGYDGFLILFEVARTNPTMTTLDLRGNLIVDNSALAFSDALRTNSTMLTLDLYHSSVGDQGARVLAVAVKTYSTITALDLGSNYIGDNGTVALAGALKTNTSLITLDLRVNSIGDSGALALSEALKTNSTLTVLNLGWNFIKDSGVLALSKALKINSSLTTLYLSFNSIGCMGARAMSKALKRNSSLTTLYLASNKIGDDGAQSLSEALKINTSLRTLDLYSNFLGNKAAQALSESLKTNSTLKSLYLGSNAIEDIGILALTEAFKTNTTLAILYLVGNPIGDNGVRALFQLSTTTRCEITHGIELRL
ncbi:hypothetical protein BGZ68_010214 [Mortierella alpina]|nr:hypothetical protein BGZ68_010214 [Mortierella alpina]